MQYYSPSRNAFILNAQIWPDAEPVDDARYQVIYAEMLAGRVLTSDENGAPITVEVPPPDPEAIPLSTVYATRFNQLNSDYDTVVQYLKASYPMAETITWTTQLSEAKIVLAWLAEDPLRVVADFPREEAPFLYDLSASRTVEGITGGLEHLANRVMENNALFSPALAAMTARRHAAEKNLQNALEAVDRTALNAVTWSFDFNGPVVDDEPAP